MRRSTRTSTYGPALLACMLLTMLVLVPAPTAGALGLPPPAAQSADAQLDGVVSNSDGSYALSPDALPAPTMLGNYQRHGIVLSAPQSFAQPVSRLQIQYQAGVPAGSAFRIDLRSSVDGSRWLPWTTELSNAAVIHFPQPIRAAQYRITLLGSTTIGPQITPPILAPTNAAATAEAAAVDPYAIAPTFRIRATRQGMIGGRTANGYIIPPKARFVSLPDWSVLSSRGGNEYQVRISYRGRSTVVPVYDVGPYSGRDDYWDIVRNGYPDLERGWPMDHAAYYEGYNNRRADKGYVRFPTAMDVGDGAWIDDLGIVGDQAEVEVTYLWLGQDPFAGPPARDPAVATTGSANLAAISGTTTAPSASARLVAARAVMPITPSVSVIRPKAPASPAGNRTSRRAVCTRCMPTSRSAPTSAPR
ncbi:MAG: hypothetical protein HC822_09705 [Oscillochloris sp.]|nr:hypothetical protein [Oscillochloris sp.]